MATSEYYLELSNNPLRFEAGNQLTNVFFDDSNKHVFAVRSGGVMGVVVKDLCQPDKPLNFRMEDRGPVLSIKFSLDLKILAVHRTNSSIEFMNFDGSSLEEEYSQSCKKNNKILGFLWTFENEVAFITDHGVELFKVLPEKRALKQLKTLSHNLQWFVWCPLNKIALLASAHGSQLQPIIFRPGTIGKLPKVESISCKMALERDITLATLYGIPAILILRHQSGPQTAEVHIHELSGPGQTPIKTHVLKLGLSGRFAINIVDNLVLVHHQASRSSQIFDIALPGESDGVVKYHTSVAAAKSFKPVNLTIPSLDGAQTLPCDLYSPNWVVFQPNIVIDAKLGCLWHINLCLPQLCNIISDLAFCCQLLLRRTKGKPVILKVLLEKIQQENPVQEKIRESFNYINKEYRDWLEVELQNQTASPAFDPIPSKPEINGNVIIIDQLEMYDNIFLKLDADAEMNRLEWVLINYLTSLCEYDIKALPNLNEMIVSTLVRRKKFATLQQLLQYGVIADSKNLACILLSLGNVYQAGTQMALDMLSRLDAKEEIQEILLSQGQILTALKLSSDKKNPRKFLQAAQDSNDEQLFHSVLYYYKNHPMHSSNFKKDSRLDSFVHFYNSIFEDK
ncbi:regulator of MON1-CCZ1 complex [Harmonia axyridis]|uniref:regulator of MON1-CCZ1 complex n=1 Tax=Harmonia axyridis TaxID=115357 RepID=UPI001E2758E9|nr:regulator of MON1-CCZ1 complex [Harmonia axyridis]